ncbi:MAG: hypothetical protein DME35_01515 [Verrucomicrobia bacterium]|nr:MAG: hypothetical protein DME35_01515 [Verrucomicrobiota bacterium]
MTKAPTASRASLFIWPSKKLTFIKENIWSANRPFPQGKKGDYIDSEGNVVVQNIDVRKDRQPRGTHFDPAKMPYCMHFNGGYAMHQGYVPPFAASHGCIRLPQGMAEHFYNNAPVGTPMTVKSRAACNCARPVSTSVDVSPWSCRRHRSSHCQRRRLKRGDWRLRRLSRPWLFLLPLEDGDANSNALRCLG